MFVAVDKNNKKVFIDDAVKGESYFCQSCHKELVVKKGEIKAHHFAHPCNSNCNDRWNYDMSEWHKWWQSLFPIENQEVVMEADGEKHRADVFVNNTVVEFQHSPLSCTEFDERNKFYTNLGYRVVWVFDVRDEFKDERIFEIPNKNNIYGWDHPFHTLENFVPEKDGQVVVYFHITDDEIFDDNNQKHPCLKKIQWISPNGLKRFRVDSKEYYEFDVPEFNKTIKTPVSSHIYNDMIGNHKKSNYGHGYMFFGCPISKSGYAVTDFDYKGNQHGNCLECKYKFDYYKCNYPEKYLEIPENAEIIKIDRDNAKFVKCVTYSVNGKIYQTKDMPHSNHCCSTIIDLWIKNNVQKAAIFRDVQTDNFVKITKNPKLQAEKYHKIYGLVSQDQYSFPSYEYSKEIYYFDQIRWVLVWPKPDELL